MVEGRIRNVELFLFGPTKIAFGFLDGLFAGRVAVRLTRTGCRHAKTNRGLY